MGDIMKFEELLRKYDLKVTKGRVAILKVLTNYHKSMGVELIFGKCKEYGVNINLSTVYRALELFEEKGIVDKFASKDGIFFYKLKGEEHKHLIRCSVCKKEIEVPCPMKQFEEMVQSETGFTLTEHNLIMTGVCEECQHNKR